MNPMMTSDSGNRDKVFYGWWMVLALFIMGVIAFGARFSFGVFFKALASEFDLTRAETSGVYSAYMLISCPFAIIIGWGVDRLSPRRLFSLMGLFIGLSFILTSQATSFRQLFLVYSLLLAIGTGGMFGASVSTTIRWFDHKRGLAIGLATSGSGLGTFMMAPFAAYLIANFGWRVSLIVMGIIAWLFIIPLSMLLKKDPNEMGLLPYGLKPDGSDRRESKLQGSCDKSAGFSVSRAVKTRNFWCLAFSWVLSPLCIYMVMTHVVPYGTDVGIPPMKAAALLGLIGIMNIPGRLLVGRISDSAGRKVTAIISALFLAAAIVWLIYSRDLWMFYLFAIVFGFFFGGISTTTAAMVGDIFGLVRIGVIMGTLSAAWALGGAIGPFLGGLVHDLWNSYSPAFAVSAAAMVAVALFLALTKRETDLDR